MILAEVNVKEIEYISDTSGVVKKKIKPNFKILGQKLGAMMKQVSANIVQMTDQQIREFEKNNSSHINLTKPIEQPKSIQSAQPTQPKPIKKDGEESDDEDVPVELEEDPNSFESIQKSLHTILNKNQEDIKSLNKNREEFKILVDKLNLILADGVEKHKVEILKKQGRIDKINDRLKVLRGKK